MQVESQRGQRARSSTSKMRCGGLRTSPTVAQHTRALMDVSEMIYYEDQ